MEKFHLRCLLILPTHLSYLLLVANTDWKNTVKKKKKKFLSSLENKVL